MTYRKNEKEPANGTEKPLGWLNSPKEQEKGRFIWATFWGDGEQTQKEIDSFVIFNYYITDSEFVKYFFKEFL